MPSPARRLEEIVAERTIAILTPVCRLAAAGIRLREQFPMLNCAEIDAARAALREQLGEEWE